MLRKCAHMFDATQIGFFGMLTFLALAHMFDATQIGGFGMWTFLELAHMFDAMQMCTHVWCYANWFLRDDNVPWSWSPFAGSHWKAPGWNGSIVEMSWLWSSKRRKKTEIEDSELTSQQRSRPYCMVIINDFGVTIGNRLEIVLFFWNKHHQNWANEQLQLGRNWCGTRSVSNPAGCLWSCPTLPETNNKSPMKIRKFPSKNTIKMVDFPASYVSLQGGQPKKSAFRSSSHPIFDRHCPLQRGTRIASIDSSWCRASWQAIRTTLLIHIYLCINTNIHNINWDVHCT